MLQLSGYDSLDLQINTFLSQTKEMNFDRTWLAVKIVDGFRPTCSFIKTALNMLEQPVGVYSSRNDWISLFGSDKGCPEVLSTTAYWNSTSGSISTTKYIRQTQTNNVSICNTTLNPYAIVS